MSRTLLKNTFKGGVLFLLTAFLSSCKEMVILDPKGPIGQRAAELINTSILLMLIVVLPVFIMVIWFTIRYRAGNKKATYKPDWAHSNTIEWFVWTIPVIIIVILSYITWTSTHELDPYKPIESDKPALRVDVISTDWNWIFVYPEDSIATINELVIEADRPVSFKLTSASVMTSFFIPHLGSQIYAMAGMQTQLNLMAQDTGVFWGRNLEYSGFGYNMMSFEVKAKTAQDFKQWVKDAKGSTSSLSMDEFNKIKQPNVDHPVVIFSSVEPDLLNKVMAPYMDWMDHSAMEGHDGHMDHSGMKMEEGEHMNHDAKSAEGEHMNHSTDKKSESKHMEHSTHGSH